MLIKSYSKINLVLNVLNKSKPSSLHDLDMINATISLCDFMFITFIENHQNKIEIKSNKNIPLNKDNLVYQVIEKYKKIYHMDFSIKVKIIKRIPLQAGLAGGSSNASNMLKALDSHFKTKMSQTNMINFLKEIGSDCPYMLFNTLARVSKKGEIIKIIKSDFKEKIFLIKPKKGNNTKEVFNNLDYQSFPRPNINKIENALKENNYEVIKNNLDNSLLDSAISLNPKIKEIMDTLRNLGFEIVCLSGSGSSIFAISKNNKPYQKAKKIFNKKDYDLVGIYKLIH